MTIPHWPYQNVLDDSPSGSMQLAQGRFSKVSNLTHRAPDPIGRMAIMVAILTFVLVYSGGIFYYGWGLGMAFGWLPSIVLAWLIALATEQIGIAFTYGVKKLLKGIAPPHGGSNARNFHS